jgi:hypothetical protein
MWGWVSRAAIFHLAQKPLDPKRGGELGTQHLDRHAAVVLLVLGEDTTAMPPRPSSPSIV